MLADIRLPSYSWGLERIYWPSGEVLKEFTAQMLSTWLSHELEMLVSLKVLGASQSQLSSNR